MGGDRVNGYFAIVGQNVGVNVGSGGEVGMAKQRLENLDRHAGRNGGGGHAVSQAVEVDRRERSSGQIARERRIEGVRVDGTVVRV